MGDDGFAAYLCTMLYYITIFIKGRLNPTFLALLFTIAGRNQGAP